MIERYTVAKKNNVYFIKDNECKQYNLPEMAVSLYFKNPSNASEVCKIMNEEWKYFLWKPE